MPRKRRQAKIPTPAWERPRGTIGSRVLGRPFQFYGAVVIGLLLVVALSIISYAFIDDEIDKRGRPGSTAIQVEDTHYRLDYFSRRLGMYVDQNGGQGAIQPISALPAVSNLIIQEEIVRRFAGEMDVTATEDEIKAQIATGLGITADDPSFDVVFEQELTRSGLDEADYRQMIEAAVLTTKLREKFLAQVPASAESVRYRQMLVSTEETAGELTSEIEAGGDFAALAAENSLDVNTKDNGGEVGWVPRGVLVASMEELIFPMEVGGLISIPTQSGVLIIEMEEKADEREVEESQKIPLADRAFASWVAEKQQSLFVVNNVDVEGDGDPDKIRWAVDRVYQS